MKEGIICDVSKAKNWVVTRITNGEQRNNSSLRVRSIERWQLTLRYIFSVNTKDYRVGQREVYSCHMENNTIII